MAKIQPLRPDPQRTNEPVSISDRAAENLKFIRETMERSTHFTAVPGWGGMLMGVTAVVATYIASQQVFLSNWLIVWLTEACLAFAIFAGKTALHQLAHGRQRTLISGEKTCRRFTVEIRQ